MIDFSAVLNILRAKYLTEGDEGELLEIIENVCRELLHSLKKKENARDYRILSLAAALVNLAILTKKALNGELISNFKAGDVSVTADTKEILNTAKQEVIDCKVCACELLKDIGFFFGQM